MPLDTSNKKPFIFLWYKKVSTASTPKLTVLFKTTVHADSRNEAIKKFANFIFNKMELCVVEEKDFDTTDMEKLNRIAKELKDAIYSECPE